MKRIRLAAGSAIAGAAVLAATMLVGSGSFSNGVAEAAAVATGPANTSRPAITGTAREGQTLQASSGTWTGTGTISYTYQWQRCDAKGASCVAIAGAQNDTYALTASDVGATVGIAVTASDSTGSATAYSDLAGPVATTGSSPAYTQQPTISGSAKENSTLTVDKGTWAGSTPMTFAYEWQRCDTAGKNCDSIGPKTTSTTYKLTSADVGHTIIAAVVASNTFGEQTGFTKPTAVVAGTTSLVPAYTAQPAISGTASVGQTLTVSNGTWAGASPITFTYQWQRCDSTGKNCGVISGATTNRYTLTTADSGHIVLAAVVAKNAYGVQTGFAAPTGAVQATAATSGAAVAVTSVSLPNRLVVSGVAFSPSRVTPETTTFDARFRVTDSNGHPVSGALVYAIGLPYARVSTAGEVPTDGNGYATISFHPLLHFSARRGYVVFFVRARKPGDNLLAGVSTRRLVQVTTGR